MEKTTKTPEEILGISSYPHECGGMIEIHTRQDSLKAMQEYADQQLAEYKAKLTKKVNQLAMDDATIRQVILLINE